MKIRFPAKSKIFEVINKYFIYLALFFVIVIVGSGVNFLLYPMWSEIQGTTIIKVDEKKDELEEARQFLRDLEELRNKYSLVDYNDIQRLAKVLPREFNEQKIYAQISDLASKNNLSLNALNISSQSNAVSSLSQRREEIPAETESNASTVGKVQEVELSIIISGIGSYEQFKSFLKSIEQEAPILTLSSFTYPPQRNSWQFSLTTYYLAEL